MIPAGSSRSFAARSTSSPSGPITPAIQGEWSRPTAGCWVIVPPRATMASHAAVFAAPHGSSSAPHLAYFDDYAITAVPEPGSIAVIAAGLLPLVGAVRRRRRRRPAAYDHE